MPVSDSKVSLRAPMTLLIEVEPSVETAFFSLLPQPTRASTSSIAAAIRQILFFMLFSSLKLFNVWIFP